MIRLILARHGNTFETGQIPVQLGRTDLSLTAFGEEQARLLARYLATLHPVAIYAGVLKRQMRTAEIIAEKVQVPLHLKETALTEIDYGLWEGLTSEGIRFRWPHEYEAWTKEAVWPKGIFDSSFQEHMQAMNEWLAQLLQTYSSGDTVVAVTSNGLLRSCFARPSVKTGHFCELELFSDRLEIKGWNLDPS